MKKGRGMNDIKVKCRHCGQFFDSEKLECPRCSKLNKNGSHPATLPKPKKKSYMQEQKIWEGNPCWMNYLLYWILGALFLLPTGIGIIFIIYAFLDRKNKIFTITTRKVLAQSGIITNKIDEIAIRDIRSTSVKQGIVGTYFDFGNVLIGSAGTAGIEVKFVGVKNPEQVMRQIRIIKDDIESGK